MGVEYEWKFAAEPELLPIIEKTYPGKTVVYQMETTYYDTQTGALSSRHYTLRRRLENGVSVCTLKTPAGSARAEWEIHCEDIAEAIKLLQNTDCPADFFTLAGEGIDPICAARFTRIAKKIILENATVELALDKGVLLGGGKEEPLCEVEVELKSGSTSECDLFAKTLAARFGLKIQPKSKFRRALALYKGE